MEVLKLVIFFFLVAPALWELPGSVAEVLDKILESIFTGADVIIVHIINIEVYSVRI